MAKNDNKCPLCGQKMDLWTPAHKSVPFVDKKTYPRICFTCFFVPKIVEQTYTTDGRVLEEVELPYSCQSLCTPKELHDSGAADSLKQAKMCVEAVKAACSGVRPDKKPQKRPAPSWNIS
jgi:hypothetical protein